MEEVWGCLFQGMKSAMNPSTSGGIDHTQWMELYTIVYNACISPHHEEANDLYQRVRQFFEKHVADLSESLKAYSDEQILFEYITRWQSYTAGTKFISSIFSYMHRYWIPKHGGEVVTIVPLRVLALLVWKEKMFLCQPRIRSVLLNTIDQKRNGEKINCQTILGVVESILTISGEVHLHDSRNTGYLDFYRSALEKEFLERTTRYFKVESVFSIGNYSVSECMLQIERRLKEELAFCKAYLHSSTAEPLKNVLLDSLIQDHTESFQAHFRPCLSQLKEFVPPIAETTVKESSVLSDLARMYRLLVHFPKMTEDLAVILKAEVLEEGTALIDDQMSATHEKEAMKKGFSCVRKMLQMHEIYSTVTKYCFQKNAQMESSLNDAFASFVNRELPVYSMPELIALHCDNLLRASSSRQRGEHILDRELSKVIDVFGYISNKDIFHETYRRSLCKRLLSKKFDEEAEGLMISKLKMHCGYEHSSKLEGMLNDVTSGILRSEWATYVSESSDLANPNISNNRICGIDLHVQVLNCMYWPITQGTDIRLPVEIGRCVEEFTKFYKNSICKKKLQWVYSLGTMQVLCRFQKKSHAVVMSPYQTCILLLFNEAPSWTIADLSSEIGLDADEIERSISPLTIPPHRILKGKTERDGTIKYAVNDNFSSKVYRLVVPPAPVRITTKESKAVKETIDQDRRYQMDAAIVRTMKSRNRLKHNELIAEVSKQLFHIFRPDPKLLKKRLEYLIDNDYLKRDSDDKQVYVYIA